MLPRQVRETQALILAPTRELAVQIQKVRRLQGPSDGREGRTAGLWDPVRFLVPTNSS